MPVLVVILVPLPKPATHPIAPSPARWPAQQHRPRRLIDNHHVLMLSLEPLHGQPRSQLVSSSRPINKTSPNNNAREIPLMVMRIPSVVRLQPVMEPHRTVSEVDHPPNSVWAISRTQLLSPDNLHSPGGGTRTPRPPLDLSGALPTELPPEIQTHHAATSHPVHALHKPIASSRSFINSLPQPLHLDLETGPTRSLRH